MTKKLCFLWKHKSLFEKQSCASMEANMFLESIFFFLFEKHNCIYLEIKYVLLVEAQLFLRSIAVIRKKQNDFFLLWK